MSLNRPQGPTQQPLSFAFFLCCPPGFNEVCKHGSRLFRPAHCQKLNSRAHFPVLAVLCSCHSSAIAPHAKPQQASYWDALLCGSSWVSGSLHALHSSLSFLTTASVVGREAPLARQGLAQPEGKHRRIPHVLLEEERLLGKNGVGALLSMRASPHQLKTVPTQDGLSRALEIPQCTPLFWGPSPRPPDVALLRALWSLLDDI